MNENFLHLHSTFSVGDSAQSPEDIVRRVSELGGKNVTLTDHRTLLGVDQFMEAGQKYGINTIPGIENEVSMPTDIIDFLAGENQDSREALAKARNHLLLVPFDYEGFQSISYATKDANTNIHHVNKKAYPCLTDEMLEKHFKGNAHIFATSACIQGPIAHILLINFRLKERMQKHLSAQTAFEADYNAYNKADKEEAEAKTKIKELKTQVTAESKPLKKPHQNKIEKLRKKLTGLSEDSSSSAYQKTLSELELALNLAEIAESKITALNGEIAVLTKAKDNAAAVKEETKKGYKKYEKALLELESYRARVVDEEILYEAAKKRLLYMKGIFPHFFLEMQNHGMEAEKYAMPLLLKLADETNTPIIAANDAHITDASEESVEARRLIRFNYFNKAETISSSDCELYIKTGSELIQALSEVIPEDRAREAVENTRILEKCRVNFPHDPHYPKVRGGKSFDELLEEARQKKVEAGLWDDTYQARLEHEIKTIKTMGYSDYHMVVEQFCRIGRLMGRVPENRRSEIYDHFADLEEWVESEGFDIGIGIGPGRGSAAGSLVCYLLGITNIDPIKYSLLFERFLNPERVSMPDIDTDIATSIRPILIAYLRWYYGEGAVCSIATVTTYGAKAAVQLAGRDRSDQLYGEKDKESKSRYLHEKTYVISDMIPAVPGTTMASCEADILPKISTDPEMMLLWNRAKLIENCVSGTGVHAGGVIISDNSNVNEYVPLAWNEEKSVWVAQCDMVMAEAKGMLKMDVLGLNTLDIANICVQLIKQHHGVSIDLNKIQFEPEVFAKIYAAGNTNGVFQVEGGGMKQMLRDFKPTCFEDIILLVAAYRPGPMQYLPDVIAVKNGRKELTYKHPMLESILSTTYGATIYQEQVMQIFQKLAGYSLGGADLVRRAMSKKKLEKLAHERDAFIHGDSKRGIDGCVKRGVNETVSNEIFDEMMEFAKYAFNKSHAAAYAYVSYQTAWLKHHYPAEYLCALFACKGQDKFAPIIADCSTYGVDLLQPDVNSSYYNFVIENGNIRYGLSGIKGIGAANEETIKRICNERKKGYYTSFQDFLKRNVNYDGEKYSAITNELLTLFIDVGMFDNMGYNREALVHVLDEYSVSKPVPSKKDFDDMVDSIEIKSFDKDSGYNFQKETELLGTICSEHPLAVYGSDESYGCTRISELVDQDVAIYGFITSVEKTVTKKGTDMLRVQIQGKTGECTALFMRNTYNLYVSSLDSYLNKVVKVFGKAKDGTIFADRMEFLQPDVQTYYLNLVNLEDQQKLMSFGEIRKEKEQDDDVQLHMQIYYYRDGKPMSRPMSITRWCTTSFVNTIRNLGIACVKR